MSTGSILGALLGDTVERSARLRISKPLPARTRSRYTDKIRAEARFPAMKNADIITMTTVLDLGVAVGFPIAAF